MTVLAPLVQHRTPNQSSRRGSPITQLVWHATIGPYGASVDWLCNPKAEASAHLVLDEHGLQASQLVHLSEKAWHAVAANSYSVGVEHASLHPGFHSLDQLRESARVFAWLCHHLGIKPVHGAGTTHGIVRHRDLGLAGGGHTDGPDDTTWFHAYLPAIRDELERGGFRKVWAL